MYQLHSEILISRDLREVFAFFGDPANLAKLTPPSVHFELLTEAPVVMQSGAELEFRIRLLGMIPVRWKSRILEYEPPFQFVDDQISGPYRRWHHRHTFRPVEGGTIVGDDVEYGLPFGVFGRMAHALLVARQLKGIFRYRHRMLDHLFPGQTRIVIAPVISPM